MHIIVRPIASSRERWAVRPGRFAVSFRNEREARRFASRQENRLKALPSWPRSEH
ncbi:hypothetical protein [Azotobacter salinestris]|uniref:hypothetical protein n=1 Tax=Azotobacter salinestris TaxID=69964 RepID=UPI00142EFEE9|nr:hypothetical protein [Azotobacter salinestris]